VSRTALFVLAASLACSPRPKPPQHDSQPVSGPPATGTAPTQDTADAWAEHSRRAAERGALDLAAAHLGRAFAREPTPERLSTYIDALVADGETRRARAVLERARDGARDPAQRQQFAARLAAIPPPGERSIAPTAATGPLRAAYEAEAAGRPDAPAQLLAALSGDADPYHLDRAAELLHARGEHVDAARLWSRARVRLHESGATVQVIPVDGWYVVGAAWVGDSLAMLRNYGPLTPLAGGPAGALELWPARAADRPTRRFTFPQKSRHFAISADGATLARDDDGSLVLQDMLTGTEQARIPIGRRINALAVDGAGADMHVLVGAESEAILYGATGEEKGRWSLAGTTPTITRVYTGEGTYHDNILEDSPTWPVTLAIAPGARLLAIGGSDSRLRLVDRDRDRVRELAFKWPYVERRYMGGNPDLNLPLALRFRDGGRELVAIHTHGDLLIWDARKATLRRRIAGDCTTAEAETYANRYTGPGQPRQPIGPEDRAACGRAHVAAISPDGNTLAAGGSLSGARVRDVSTGDPIALMVGSDLPDMYMSLGTSGALALVDLYGARAQWRPGLAEPEPIAPPAASSPIEPTITPDGRFLVFAIDHRRTVAWDLRERRPLAFAADERLVALADDGRHAAVLARGNLEVRDLAARTTVHSLPIKAHPMSVRAQFSRGHVLLDSDDGTGRAPLLLDLATGKTRPLPAALADRELTLSADGRWLAAALRSADLQIWRTDPGELARTLGKDTSHLAFARDGSFVAWIRHDDRSQRHVTLGTSSLNDPGGSAELGADGWPSAIAVTPDGADVLALLEDKIVRWHLADRTSRVVADNWLIGGRRLVPAADGKTIFVLAFDRVDIRRNDESLTLLAHLYPLRTGGWLAHSRAGGLDGSDDAVDHLLARVAGQGGEFVADGRLVWDALHTDDLLARSLAGDDAPPPLALPAPPPP
jgi:WD40 repeat protein